MAFDASNVFTYPGGQRDSGVEAVSAIVWKRPTVKEMHGFYVNEKRKSISFDIVISFDDKNRFSTFNSIVSEIAERYPDYRIKVGLDPDVND